MKTKIKIHDLYEIDETILASKKIENEGIPIEKIKFQIIENKISLEITCFKSEFNSSQSSSLKNRTKNKIIYSIKKLTPFKKLNKFKYIKSLVYIDKDIFKNLYEFNCFMEQFKESNLTYLFIINGNLNVIEKFIIKELNYFYKENFFSISSEEKSQNSIPFFVYYLAQYFNLNLQSVTNFKEIHKIMGNRKLNETQTSYNEKKMSGNIFLNSKLDNLINSLEIKSEEKKKWNWKNFSEFNFKNCFYKIDHQSLNDDLIKFIVSNEISIVKSNIRPDTNEVFKLEIPGMVEVSNKEELKQLISEAVRNKKCYWFESLAKNKINLHVCFDQKCEVEKNSTIIFTDFLTKFPVRKIVPKINNKLKKTICLVLPPYTKLSGGIVALYKLHDLLKNNGYKVLVLPYNAGATFPNNKKLNLLVDYLEDIDPNDLIWIYGDTIVSLPFAAEKQIQWQLNRPGFLPGSNLGTHIVNPKWIWKYSDLITSNSYGKLFISNFDFDLFYPRKVLKNRNNLHYFGKSKIQTLESFNKFYKHNDLILKRDFPSRDSLPYYFSHFSKLVSYDPVSAINLEANLCGIPTLVILDQQSEFTKQDILKFELPTFGLIFEDESQDKKIDLNLDFHQYFKEEAIKLESSTVQNFFTFLDKEFN